MENTRKLRERKKVVNYYASYSDDDTEGVYRETAELSKSPSPDDREYLGFQRSWREDGTSEDSSDHDEDLTLAKEKKRNARSFHPKNTRRSSEAEKRLEAASSSRPHPTVTVKNSNVDCVLLLDMDDDGNGFKTPFSILSSKKRKYISSAVQVTVQRPRRGGRINYKEESDTELDVDENQGMMGESLGEMKLSQASDMVLDRCEHISNSSDNQKVSVPGRRRLTKLAGCSPIWAERVPKVDLSDIEDPQHFACARTNLEGKYSNDSNNGASLRVYSRNYKSAKQSEGTIDCTSETKSEQLGNGFELRDNCTRKYFVDNDFLPGEVEFLPNTYKRIRKTMIPEQLPSENKCSVKYEEIANETCIPPIPLDTKVIVPSLKVGVFGPFTGESDQRPVVKRIGQVEKILSVKNRNTNSAVFCVKEYGKSYRGAVDVPEETLLNNCPQLVRHFLRRMDDLKRLDGNLGESEDSPAFCPSYIEIDRIIASEQRGRKKRYLVKWHGLPYSEATWEWEGNLLEDKEAIQHFEKVNSKPTRALSSKKKSAFRDGRTLRDYQERGLSWLDHNFRRHINCILADEMGLGKTMQSVAMLQNLRTKWKVRGPFLVIAPVSTLGHWRREIESLTDMNCVVYSGSMEDREIIKEYEFYYFGSKSSDLKFNVLLTSFEILMKDQSFLSKHEWQYIIVDEAHRLKTKDSKTTRTLKQLIVGKGGLLLLTGTPIQNNTREIFSLLNVLDPDQFDSEDEFLLKYGDIKDAEQVKDLQENILKPRLLRRMKEDVEKSIPLKEETIIWVELTREQRSYYRAIYENRISDLLRGSQISNMPNLRNVAMEIRKLCNHPFLCDGLEEDLNLKYTLNGQQSVNGKGRTELSRKVLCQSSGKMLLLDKLLPMLKNDGCRVLIFSQFTIMLDLLEEYLHTKGYTFERIDGKIRGSDRQAAIDRYSAEGSDTFVFLLSTRAGGLGITLTAANTCIIYDSDWNPQNDLQAMARCHRIGQTKDVKIYRLITRNTYEQHLFECSSRKYGLDEAILGNMLGTNGDHEYNRNIESLLKCGAYDILKDDGEAEAAAFHAENIDQILQQRTQKRLIGGRGNNAFSVATFISNLDIESDVPEAKDCDLNKDSIQFWQELLPEAYHTALNAEKQEDIPFGGRRKRERVNYREKHENSDETSSESDEEIKREGRKQLIGVKHTNDMLEENDEKQWTEKELRQLENRLIMLGKNRIEQVMVEAGLQHHGVAEVHLVADTLVQMCQCLEEVAIDYEIKKNPSEQLGKKFHEAAIHHNPIELNECNSICSSIRSESEVESGRKVMCRHEGNAESVGDVQIARNLIRTGNKNAITLPDNFKLPEIPSFAQAMRSHGFIARLQRNASRYLQILHEREVLEKGLSSGKPHPLSLPRTKKMPLWWGEAEDLDLMKGAYKHGHKDFSKIRDDENLCFAARLDAPRSCPDVILLPMECDFDSAVFHNGSSDAEDQKDDWPHDSVLMLRLKRLIECLPNGLSERELKKRAAVNEYAKRRQQEIRATKLKQEARNACHSNLMGIQEESKDLEYSSQVQQCNQEGSIVKLKQEARNACHSNFVGKQEECKDTEFKSQVQQCNQEGTVLKLKQEARNACHSNFIGIQEESKGTEYNCQVQQCNQSGAIIKLKQEARNARHSNFVGIQEESKDTEYNSQVQQGNQEGTSVSHTHGHLANSRESTQPQQLEEDNSSCQIVLERQSRSQTQLHDQAATISHTSFSVKHWEPDGLQPYQFKLTSSSCQQSCQGKSVTVPVFKDLCFSVSSSNLPLGRQDVSGQNALPDSRHRRHTLGLLETVEEAGIVGNDGDLRNDAARISSNQLLSNQPFCESMTEPFMTSTNHYGCQSARPSFQGDMQQQMMSLVPAGSDAPLLETVNDTYNSEPPRRI